MPRLLLPCLLLVPLGCRSSPPCADLGPEDVETLLALARADQEARAALAAWTREHPGADQVPDDVVLPVLEADLRARDYLRGLLERGVWPCISDVGPEAAGAAWLLVQHADREPWMQERALELMERLVPAGEANRGDLALLTDEVRVREGRPQVYGNQWVTRRVDGELRLEPATPIEDPERVDERRAEAGLVPLEDYLETLRRSYGLAEG